MKQNFTLQKTFLSFILLILTNHLLNATILHVDVSGSAPPGAYSDIQDAVDDASGTDTVLIAPGIWCQPNDGFTVDHGKLTIASWALTTGDLSYIESTIIDGHQENCGDGNTYNSQSKFGFDIITIVQPAEDGTRVYGLTFRHGRNGMHPEVGVKVDLEHLLITNNDDGIDFENGSGGTWTNLVVQNNQDDGFDLDGDIIDMVLTNSIFRGNDQDGVEIRLNGYNGPILTSIIRNCEFYDNLETGIQLIDHGEDTDREFIIEGNKFYDNDMVGFSCQGNENTFENFEGYAIQEVVYMYNNTFYGENHGISGGGQTLALNNIFVNCTKAVKNLSNSGSNSSIVDYCDFYNNNTNNDNSTLGSNNIFTDPDLTTVSVTFEHWNYGVTTYTCGGAPNLGSPCIDTGTESYTWEGTNYTNIPSYGFFWASTRYGSY